MNFNTVLIIVLAISLIVVFWWGYRKISRRNTTVESIDLSIQTKTVEGTGKNNTVFTMESWVYVTGWTNVKKLIIQKPSAQTQQGYEIYLKDASPALVFAITNIPGPVPDAVPVVVKEYTITENFPLQKWTFLTIVKSGRVLDVYVDGQLVKSVQLEREYAYSEQPIVLGSDTNKPPIKLSGFSRRNTALSPKEVEDQYKVTGRSLKMPDLPSYTAEVNVLKNGELAQKISVF